MKATNLANLVADAVRHGEASASSGKWRAYREVRYMPDADTPGDLATITAVDVWHHRARMFRVYVDRNGSRFPGRVLPLDSGYGSTSDRCGVRRITEGAGCGIGYRELYGGGS